MAFRKPSPPKALEIKNPLEGVFTPYLLHVRFALVNLKHYAYGGINLHGDTRTEECAK